MQAKSVNVLTESRKQNSSAICKVLIKENTYPFQKVIFEHLNDVRCRVVAIVVKCDLIPDKLFKDKDEQFIIVPTECQVLRERLKILIQVNIYNMYNQKLVE